MAGIRVRHLVAISRGKGRRGYCPICERPTVFVETSPWLRDSYRCFWCQSTPRWRALVRVLNDEFPNWKHLTIHEVSGGGPATRMLRRKGTSFSVSGVGPNPSEDVENLRQPDRSFDLVVTQDVLEHVLNPERAFSEIARVLRPGGAHVFTVPVKHGSKTVVRVEPSPEGLCYLEEPQYHGADLVIRDWGDDLAEFVQMSSGLEVDAFDLRDERQGIVAESLVVFVARKPEALPAGQ